MALRNISSQSQIIKNVKLLNDENTSKQQTKEEQEEKPKAKSIEISTNRLDAETILDAQVNMALQNKLDLEIKGKLIGINPNIIPDSVVEAPDNEEIKDAKFFGKFSIDDFKPINIEPIIPEIDIDIERLTQQLNEMLEAFNKDDFSNLLTLIKMYSGKISARVINNETNGKKSLVISLQGKELNQNIEVTINDENIDANLLADVINNAVCNNDMNGTEVLNTTNECLDFIKSYLKNKYGYSDEYLKIISSATENLVVTEGPYTEEEIQALAEKKREKLSNKKMGLFKNSPKYTEEEVEQLVQEYIIDLRAMGHYNGSEILNSFGENLNSVLSPAINDNKTYDSSYITGFYKFNNSVGQYIDDLISQKFEELELSDEERKAFCTKLYKALGAKKDEYGYYIDTEVLKSINKNGDNSSFDEILDTAMELLSQTKHMSDEEIDNANFIDTDKLFDLGHVTVLLKLFGGTKEVLSAKDILNNFEEMVLSDDPGIRKFAKLLESVFDKFDCRYESDKEEVLSNLIKLINKEGQALFSNTNLKQNAFNRLNQGNIFDTLQKIVDSQKFYYMNMLNIDGDIDDFKQGQTGDCWLLSAIEALSATVAGQRILREQIKWADDYSSVTVYFAGMDKYVTLSAESIIEAREERRLSRGDGDVLVLELAMEQVYGDIDGNWPDTFWSRFIKGGTNKEYRNIGKGLKRLLQAKQEGKNFAATFAIKGACSCKCEDGSTFSYNSEDGHALAITDITSSTVTFVNPWDSNKEYTVTWEEFNKLTAYRISMYSF